MTSRFSQSSNVCFSASLVSHLTLHLRIWVLTWLVLPLRMMRQLKKPLNKKSSVATIKPFLISKMNVCLRLLSRRLSCSWTILVSRLKIAKWSLQHALRLKKQVVLPLPSNCRMVKSSLVKIRNSLVQQLQLWLMLSRLLQALLMKRNLSSLR